MFDIIFHLVRFLADDNTRLACLSGIVFGFCFVPVSFMIGLRFSRSYVQFLVTKSRERKEKKEEKNLCQALETGMVLSPDGRFIIDGDGTRLCKPCIRAGRSVAVTALGDGTYRCPFCAREVYVPVTEEIFIKHH